MLLLYNTNHGKIGALIDYKDYHVEQAINIDDLLHFSYPVGGLNYSQIAFECYIQDGVDEYVIKEINIQSAENGIEWAQIVCKINLEDLKGHTVASFVTVGQKAEDAANLALTGTGWTVGYCDVTKLRTVRKAQCSAYDVLMEITKSYTCEITYNAILKTVIIHQKQGADRGTYFAEQLNLKQLQSQGNSNGYITRIIPVGKDGLDITSVNAANGGVNYVSNYQYSNKIITGYWVDNRYTVAQDLKDDAIERLAYLSKPTRAYAASIIDLANVSPEWGILDFGLGDFITLLSESKNIREQQRIVKIDRYPEEPERSTIQIANRIVSLEDIILRMSDATDTVEMTTDTAGSVVASSVAGNLNNAYIAMANVGDLNVTIADIGTLIATKATITSLNAVDARIDTITAGTVTTEDLNATNARVGTLEVNSATITQLNATNASITNIVITTAKIQDLAVTTAKIGLLQVTSAVIADLAVGTAKIANLAVTAAQIGNAAIENAKIDRASINKLVVVSGDIGLLAVGTAQIQTAAITTALIGTSAVGTTQIADGSITDAKVVSLTANKLTAGTIDAALITVTNLNAANITVGTINGVQIAEGAIGTANIALLAVTNTLIAANTITGDKLVVDAITAREIAAATITANEIAALTITAAKIAAGTITADKLTVGTITAASGIIGSIDASKITTGTLSANFISGGTLILGGSANVNGVFNIKNALGATVVTGDNTGLVVDGGSYYIVEPGTQALKTTVYSLPNLLADSSFEGILNYDINPADVLGQPPNLTYYDYNPELRGNWFGWNTYVWSGSAETTKMIPHWDTSRHTFEKKEASSGQSMAVVNSANHYSQGVDLAPGQTYFLSASHRQMIGTGRRSIAASKLRLEVAWSSGWTVTGVVVTQDFVSTTAWQRSGFLITVPATGVNGARIRIKSPDGNWIYVDGVQLVQGSVPGKFEPNDDLWSHINGETGFNTGVTYQDGLTGNLNVLTNLTAIATIVFPLPYKTGKVPHVQLQLNGMSTASQVTLNASSITNTGFNINGSGSVALIVTVGWSAIG